jgi:hypothetical protein
VPDSNPTPIKMLPSKGLNVYSDPSTLDPNTAIDCNNIIVDKGTFEARPGMVIAPAIAYDGFGSTWNTPYAVPATPLAAIKATFSNSTAKLLRVPSIITLTPAPHQPRGLNSHYLRGLI